MNLKDVQSCIRTSFQYALIIGIRCRSSDAYISDQIWNYHFMVKFIQKVRSCNVERRFSIKKKWRDTETVSSILYCNGFKFRYLYFSDQEYVKTLIIHDFALYYSLIQKVIYRQRIITERYFMKDNVMTSSHRDLNKCNQFYTDSFENLRKSCLSFIESEQLK